MASIRARMQQLQSFTRDAGIARRGVRPIMRLCMMQDVSLHQVKVKETILDPGDGFGPLVAGKANNLLSSWSPHVNEDGTRGSLDTSKIYSSVMEEGRRPGQKQPPREAIENWLRDKRIVDRIEVPKPKGGRRGGKKRLTASQRRERAIQALAFVIARSIGKKGIKGRFYVKKAIAKAAPLRPAIWAQVPDFVVTTLVSRS